MAASLSPITAYFIALCKLFSKHECACAHGTTTPFMAGEKICVGLPVIKIHGDMADGLGAIDVDGVMVDAASIRIVQNLLDRADLIGI